MEYLENHLNDNSNEFDIPELEVRQVYTDADFVPVPEVSQSVMLYGSGDQTMIEEFISQSAPASLLSQLSTMGVLLTITQTRLKLMESRKLNIADPSSAVCSVDVGSLSDRRWPLPGKGHKCAWLLCT